MDPKRDNSFINLNNKVFNTHFVTVTLCDCAQHSHVLQLPTRCAVLKTIPVILPIFVNNIR